MKNISLIPRITVVIITYKQERLIKRSLDSVLNQRLYGLKEIIISDDCSPDNTWGVILEYKENYPNLIKPYRNEKNLGIYGNIQKSLTYVEDTDIVLTLSGDDTFCPDYLKSIIRAVNEYNIDLSSCFSLFCDWQMIRPSGEKRIFRQNVIKKYTKREDLISLKIRNILCGRSRVTSFATVKKYHRVPIDKGVSYAENLFDLQPYIYSDRFYYFPCVGTTYYSSIGVSRNMDNKNEFEVLSNVYEYMQTLPYFRKHDIFYLKHLVSKNKFYINKNLKELLKVFVYFFKSYKYSYSIRRLIAGVYHLIVF